MKHPLVSVVIPTYNRVDLLPQAVSSVLEQTFVNFNLIIVDDCSTDGTQEYCQQLIRQHPQIHYYRHTTNHGMIGAWNSGLQKATGQYLTLLMSDDVLAKDFLARTVEALEQHSQAGLAVVWVDSFTRSPGDTPPTKRYKLFDQSRLISGRDCTLRYLRDKWLVGLPSAILARKACFDEFGYFDPVSLDPEMWLRINQKYDIYYVDERLAFWREDETQTSFTNTQTLEDFYTRAFAVVDQIARYEAWKDDVEIQQAIGFAYQKLRLRLLRELSKGQRYSRQWKTALYVYRGRATVPDVFSDLMVLLQQQLHSLIIYPVAKLRASR